jgi:hypothetical protein
VTDCAALEFDLDAPGVCLAMLDMLCTNRVDRFSKEPGSVHEVGAVRKEQVALAVGFPVAWWSTAVRGFDRHRIQVVLHGVAVDRVVVPGVES